MMPLFRRSATRWAWALPLGATLLVAACDARSSFPSAERDWGFVTVAAQQAGGGTYRTVPSGVFFRGAISSVPNAAVLLDSCVPAVQFIPPADISGVLYLDAGDAISAKIGNLTESLPRVAVSGRTRYEKPAQPTTYVPGDSVVITVPGATAGYPGTELRGKSAEAFTINPIVPPAGSEAIQLRWTPGQDQNGALILSLRYAPAGSGTISQVITCSFRDDGIDSIPFRQHQTWSANSNSTRDAIATRLRTSIKSVSNNGIIELISTFQVPTPAAP